MVNPTRTRSLERPICYIFLSQDFFFFPYHSYTASYFEKCQELKVKSCVQIWAEVELPYSVDADSRHERNLPRLVVGFSEFGLLAYGVCGKAGVLKCTSNAGVACMLAVN